MSPDTWRMALQAWIQNGFEFLDFIPQITVHEFVETAGTMESRNESPYWTCASPES